MCSDSLSHPSMSTHVPVAEVRGTPTTRSAPPSAHSHSAHVVDQRALSSFVLCDVCCEHVPPSSLRGCSGCTHRYCASCVEKHWTASIYSGNHARLHCMYGGCAVFATDDDIVNVVCHRTYRKMLYFRSRDQYSTLPGARWCAADLCWQYLGDFEQLAHTRRADQPHTVACPRCSAKTCFKCERQLSFSTAVHVCASRKSNKAHNAMFGVWAMLHTKSCPACAARIQRNHGCSHMTCTRCSSYFCWRCKGFLNNGCTLPGRACICDRVMTAAAYSGLAVAGVIGSPLIFGAMLLGGPPYLAYRVVKARRTRALVRRNDALYRRQHDDNLQRTRNAFIANRSILRPDELLVNDDDLESESYMTIAESTLEDIRIVHSHRPGRPRKQKATQLELNDTLVIEERVMGPSRSGPRLTSSATELALRPDIVVVPHTSASTDGAPSVFVESCRSSRTFVLERRRGTSPASRTMRRSVA
eukprot:TRINITY_DN1611_c0_g1_i1.p1 TRINITY_DN1611_c0_g1~~TRINITY_DN1611_c0_g1_i1.p1  ORF type:complete len:472 (-),score=51.39 TRINITY_DN1611_c0_g1_i1:782-2197(-)